MAKRTRFAEYKDRYNNCKFELSDEGILLMQCHTNDGSLVWDWAAHDGISDAFADVAGDREIKVLIHTGTGENYNANWGGPGHASAQNPVYLAMDGPEGLLTLDEKAWYGRMLIENVLAVEVPMISAVNGPCNIHAEVPLLGDIVIASEDAYFQDLAHFPRGMVPGNDAHVLWPLLVGRNRGRYLLLTGKKLSAAGGVRLGRDQRSAPEGPGARPGVGAGARARDAASAGAAVHPTALHPGSQAGVPRRVGSRPGPRDVRAAPVLPVRWWDAGSGPPVGSEALVGLIVRRRQGGGSRHLGHERGGAVNRRPFGTTGVGVAPLVLGAMNFGAPTPPDESAVMMNPRSMAVSR